MGPPDLPKSERVRKWFVLRYALRNPDFGQGWPKHGVHDISVVHQYARALQRAYRKLIQQCGWQPFSQLPVSVHIYSIPREVCGFATPRRHGGPSLQLNSGGSEPQPQDARQRRQASAVHELTHLFQFDFGLLSSWKWFDEASATAMESFILRGNIDYFRFLPDWFTSPEAPIDSGSGYRASAFVGYVMRRFGAKIIPETYNKMATSPQAVDALAAAVQERGQSLSVVFGSSYCPDAYFLQDPRSGCHNKALYARYGERAVTESFGQQYPVVNAAGHDSIDHLGCRYYRFRPTRSGSKLKITVDLLGDDAQMYLRGELIGVDHQMRRLRTVSLACSTAPSLMTATLDNFKEDKLDHVVLVIANCAYGFGAPNELTFSISAEVA